jgi:hypothetical protein
MTTKTTFIGVASHTDHPNYHALTCLPCFVTFFVTLYLVLISPHLSLLSPTKKVSTQTQNHELPYKLIAMSLDKVPTSILTSKGTWLAMLQLMVLRM